MPTNEWVAGEFPCIGHPQAQNGISRAFRTRNVDFVEDDPVRARVFVLSPVLLSHQCLS